MYFRTDLRLRPRAQIVQEFQEWLARLLQLLFEPRGAVAISAGPRLRTVLVAAFTTVVSVLYLDQVEILLPIGMLLLQRRGAGADFDPAHRLVFQKPRLVHSTHVFSPRR